MKKRIEAFRDEYFDSGEPKIYGSGGIHHYEDLDQWFYDIKRPTNQWPPEMLPVTVYLALRVSDNTLVGVTNIRPYLDAERYHNGHIGYSVRPSERRKGYGTEILRLAIIKAEQLGVMDVVVSCNKRNIASKRVILNNKLHFAQEHREADGNIVLVYHTAP